MTARRAAARADTPPFRHYFSHARELLTQQTLSPPLEPTPSPFDYCHYEPDYAMPSHIRQPLLPLTPSPRCRLLHAATISFRR